MLLGQFHKLAMVHTTSTSQHNTWTFVVSCDVVYQVLAADGSVSLGEYLVMFKEEMQYQKFNKRLLHLKRKKEKKNQYAVLYNLPIYFYKKILIITIIFRNPI